MDDDMGMRIFIDFGGIPSRLQLEGTAYPQINERIHYQGVFYRVARVLHDIDENEIVIEAGQV